MKMRKWPFEGDSQVARARKVGLAYRHVAKDYETALAELYEIIARVDQRIVGWIEDEQFTALYELAKKSLPKGVHEPTQVDEMDLRFYEWGEDWHASVVRAYDDDEWITNDEAAAILCVAGNSVSRARLRGRIEGRLVKESGRNTPRWYFRAGDIYRLQRELRGRSSHHEDATDTVHNQEP